MLWLARSPLRTASAPGVCATEGARRGNPVAQSSPGRLELLSIALADIRGIVESMLRSVKNAESCLEDFRRRADRNALGAVGDHLSHVTIESGGLLESIAAAREPLLALLHITPNVT